MEDVEERFLALKAQKSVAAPKVDAVEATEEKKASEDKEMKSEDKPKESESTLLNVLMSSEKANEPAGDDKMKAEVKEEKQLPEAAQKILQELQSAEDEAAKKSADAIWPQTATAVQDDNDEATISLQIGGSNQPASAMFMKKAEAVLGKASALANEASGSAFLSMLRRHGDDPDKYIDRVMRREQELMRKLAEKMGRGGGPDKLSAEQEMNAFERELTKRSLEDLVTEEGEDVDFEFYFEGRRVSNLSRTLFEMVKEQEHRRKQSDKNFE